MGFLDVFRKEAPVVEKEASTEMELGVVGLRSNSGTVNEEFINKLRFPQAAKIYQEMSDNDPVIGAVLYLSEMLLRKTDWSVTPASDSPLDLEIAAFVQQCMDDMETSWSDVINEVISMLVYGFSFHEIVYKRRLRSKGNSIYDDGRIGWAKLPIRSQSSMYDWIFDASGNAIAFRQQAETDYIIRTIPLRKGLLFRTRISRNNPEGKSLLRNAYRPWYFKKRIEEIEAIGIERDLAGLPLIIPKEGVNVFGNDPMAKSLLNQCKTIVSETRRDKNEGIVLPFGWDFKLLSTGGSRQFDTNAIINRYDHRIAMVLLSDLVMMGQSSVGSYALADVKKSVLAAALEAQSKNIASVFNKDAVPRLVDLNFANVSSYPKIVPGEIENPDVREIGLFFRNAGLNIMKDIKLYNYMSSIIGAPEITEKQFEAMKEAQNEPDPIKDSGGISE